MAKIQMVQIYSASVMFGYFLRKVDKRFQLAKSLGMLPVEKEEAVSRLERLFSMVRPCLLCLFSMVYLFSWYAFSLWYAPESAAWERAHIHFVLGQLRQCQ